MYSWPPTSGSRARFLIDTLANPPPCSGSQPSVLSSRVITWARTFTSESLNGVNKIRWKKKKKKENRSAMSSSTTGSVPGVNETYSSYSSVIAILRRSFELKLSRWHEIQHFYELKTSRRASMWTWLVLHFLFFSLRISI